MIYSKQEGESVFVLGCPLHMHSGKDFHSDVQLVSPANPWQKTPVDQIYNLCFRLGLVLQLNRAQTLAFLKKP